jgi:CHAD domain-containing protein
MAVVPAQDARTFGLELTREQLSRLRAHQEGTRLGEDDEELHAMRVALRRLRTILKVYRDVLPQSLSVQRDALDGFDRVLGAARDLDTQVALLGTTDTSQDGAAPDVSAALNNQRRTAHEQLAEALCGQTYHDLIAALETAIDGAPPAADAPPIRDFARKTVSMAYRRYRRKAKRLTSSSTSSELHEVRKRARRLRYVVEFVRNLYGAPARRFLKALEAEQDLLGEHQDCVTFIGRLKQLDQFEDSRRRDTRRLIAERLSRMRELRSELPPALAVVHSEWKALNVEL